MKKSIKIILATLLFLAFPLANAQENCNVVCHNGTTITLNDSSLNGHLQHGDTFISVCSEFTGEIGSDCTTLSLPELDLSKSIPLGVEYIIYEIKGAKITHGITNSYFMENIPRGKVVLIVIKGYKPLKMINN